MYHLYGFFTQNSMKPLYALEAIGAPFEFHYVNLMKGDNRTDEFRAMTPVGKVPVLRHGDRCLFESGAICRYVANQEESDLYPADPWERALVDQWLDFFSCHLGDALVTIYFQNVIKPKAGLGEPDQEACDKAAGFAVRHLKALERHMADKKFLCGDSQSIADWCALAYLEQVKHIDFSLDGFPSVLALYQKLDSSEIAAKARARLP